MRTRYQLVVNNYVVASWLLYGDEDEDTRKVFLNLMNEAQAMARVCGGRGVRVLKDEVDGPC